MGMVEEVGTFLDSGSTRWALGTSLYLNYLPDEPNRASALFETPGLPPAQVFGEDLPAWERGRLQLACRSTASATARADANAAWFLLQQVANDTLSSRSYLRITAVQSPFLLERDDQGRVTFACNYDVWRATTST